MDTSLATIARLQPHAASHLSLCWPPTNQQWGSFTLQQLAKNLDS